MNEEDFLLKAAQLSRAAPAQWNEFLAELAKYSARRAAECIQTPASASNAVFVAQGHAQRCEKLLSELTSCREKAEAIVKKRSTR